MASTSTKAGIAHLIRGICAQGAERQSDGQLLRRFLDRREEAAFAALVDRHGPMVLGVCRRVLGNADDAEDAFQATFLVLARNAAALARRAVLGDWLHGVARRTALNARRLAATRRTKERAMARSAAASEANRNDWLPLLDEELEKLPQKYRLAIVLCELEGCTRREAAERLGWPEGTVAGRLARGRNLLAARLTRRGAALSVGAVTAGLAQSGVSAALAASTVKAATTGATSATVAAILQEVVKSMLLKKLKAAGAAAMALLTAVAICYGALADGRGGEHGKAAEARAAEPDPDERKSAATFGEPFDQFGDPLPPEALARLGTIRLRHGHGVNAIVFAPDGKSLASAGGDGTVHVWDSATGKENLRIKSKYEIFLGRSVYALAFTPDGIGLIGTRQNEPPCLWDAVTGKELRVFGGAERRAGWLSLSPDGCFLAYGGAYHEPSKSWLAEVRTGKELRQFDAAWAVFSPDSKSLAYAGAKDGALVHLAESSTGKVLRHFDGHQKQAVRAAFSPDGSILATADDRMLRLIALANGQVREIGRPEGQSPAANTLMFSPDGKTLAATGAEGDKLRIVNVAKGETIGAREFLDKRDKIWSVLFTRDSKAIISGHEDGYFRFWDTKAAAKIKEFRANATSAIDGLLALSPDGRTLATSGWPRGVLGGDSSVRLWELDTGKPLALPLGPLTGVCFLTFSPDGRRVATGSSTGDTLLWDSSTGKLLRRWPVFGPLAFTSGSATLICGAWDGKVHCFDVATGQKFQQFQAHQERLYAPGLSADVKTLVYYTVGLNGDRKTLVAVGKDRVLRLWDLATGRQLQDFGGQQKENLQQPVLSPDGKLVAVHYHKGIQHWDTTTGKLVREHIVPKSYAITDIAFSGNGKLLATSHRAAIPGSQSEHYWIHVQDVATGKEIRQITTDMVEAIAFSPDGRTLIGGGERSPDLYVWEVATGKLRHKFAGHLGTVWRVAFAPNGRTMASGSADGSVLIWDVTGARSRQKPAPELSANQLDKLWTDLAAEDAGLAFAAMRTLRSAPGQAVNLIAQHLKPAPKVDPKRLAAALAQLDSDEFKARDEAKKELEAMGESVEAELRRALANKPTVEVSRRLQQILARLEGVELLRRGRALEVLEQIGDLARPLLSALARGAPAAQLTQDARAALERSER